MEEVCLLTGKPGTGKTSLIKKAIRGIKDQADGFYTEEIRDKGKREGFRIITLEGQEAVLAATSIASRFRISKYGVDIDSLEKIGISALQRAIKHRKLVVIDEIGKMELCSEKFSKVVLDIIEGTNKVLGTIMSTSDHYTEVIKSNPRVRLIQVTKTNREQVLAEILTWLSWVKNITE